MTVDLDHYRSRLVLRDLLRRLSAEEAAALRSFVREIASGALRKGILTGAAILHASLEHEIDLDRAVESLLAIGTADDGQRAEAPAAPTLCRTLTRVA
jgi:hypothetical protein